MWLYIFKVILSFISMLTCFNQMVCPGGSQAFMDTRRHLFSLIHGPYYIIYAMGDMSWLVLGDFNEIVALEEKFGRDDRSLSQMEVFRDTLTDWSLLDLGFVGPLFTWSNRRLDDALVRVRLDRGVANPEWNLLFPNAIVRHLVVASSDHMGLLVDCVLGPAQATQRRRRLFRFEDTWVREPRCEDVIQEAWNSSTSGSPMFCLTQKIKECRVQLLKWSQSQVRATPNLIANKKVRLQVLEGQPIYEFV